MLISKLNCNVLGWLVNGESIVLQSQVSCWLVGYKTNQFVITDVFSDHDSKFTIHFVLRILEEVPKIIDGVFGELPIRSCEMLIVAPIASFQLMDPQSSSLFHFSAM